MVVVYSDLGSLKSVLKCQFYWLFCFQVQRKMCEPPTWWGYPRATQCIGCIREFGKVNNLKGLKAGFLGIFQGIPVPDKGRGWNGSRAVLRNSKRLAPIGSVPHVDRRIPDLALRLARKSRLYRPLTCGKQVAACLYDSCGTRGSHEVIGPLDRACPPDQPT